jgi:hypothetical protein
MQKKAKTRIGQRILCKYGYKSIVMFAFGSDVYLGLQYYILETKIKTK